MAHRIKQIIHDTSGATAIEYGLIVGLIAVAIMTSVVGLADGVQSSYSHTAASVATATS